MAKKCGICRALGSGTPVKKIEPGPVGLGPCSFAGCQRGAAEVDGDGEAWCREHGRAVFAPASTPVRPKAKDAGALLLVRRALDLVELAGGIDALDALVRDARGLRRGA